MDVNGILISQSSHSTDALAPPNISWLVDHIQIKRSVDNMF